MDWKWFWDGPEGSIYLSLRVRPMFLRSFGVKMLIMKIWLEMWKTREFSHLKWSEKTQKWPKWVENCSGMNLGHIPTYIEAKKSKKWLWKVKKRAFLVSETKIWLEIWLAKTGPKRGLKMVRKDLKLIQMDWNLLWGVSRPILKAWVCFGSFKKSKIFTFEHEILTRKVKVG